MGRRILIIGAGTGSGNNLIRSLRAGDPSLVIVGAHADRFALKQSLADRNYLLNPSTHPAFLDALNGLVRAERIELTIPTSDDDVFAIARLGERLLCKTFLPRADMIALCQDKFALATLLRLHGLPAPITCSLTTLDDIDEVFGRVSDGAGVWCRLRRGQGAMGAIRAMSPRQVENWIRLWQELRGAPPSAFALSEYLPGRDIAAQTLWTRGRPVLIKTYERLSYLGAANLHGSSSVASLSKTISDTRVAEMCVGATRAIAPDASGVLVFDFKENACGVPCITEINAGRFGMSTNIFDLPGKHNMAVTYVRLALGDTVDIPDVYDTAEDYYMVRAVDTTPTIHHASEFFEGIDDARSAAEETTRT